MRDKPPTLPRVLLIPPTTGYAIFANTPVHGKEKVALTGSDRGDAGVQSLDRAVRRKFRFVRR